MVTQYQAEFEKVVHETLEDLCNRYKNPTMQGAFELFAASVIWAATGIKPHVPNRNAPPRPVNRPGRITGGFKVKKK
jgi:hypothetical protein